MSVKQRSQLEGLKPKMRNSKLEMGLKGNKCKTKGLKRRPTCTADHLPQLSTSFFFSLYRVKFRVFEEFKGQQKHLSSDMLCASPTECEILYTARMSAACNILF